MPVAPATSFWTPDREAFLREHARALTTRQIAQELGCTRNAVISKAHRMGVSIFVVDNRDEKTRRDDRLAYLRNRYAMLRAAGALVYRPRPRPVSPDERPSKHLALIELEAGKCHWPDDGGPPHAFCGNPTNTSRSYCPFHTKLSLDQRRH